MTRVVLALLFIISSFSGLAQVTRDTTQSGAGSTRDSAKVIKLIRAEKYRRVKVDSVTELNQLIGNVMLQQGTTVFTCDSAVQNVQLNQIEAFGNVHINDADSIQTYSQYAKYLGNSKIAYLKKKVS